MVEPKVVLYVSHVNESKSTMLDAVEALGQATQGKVRARQRQPRQ